MEQGYIKSPLTWFPAAPSHFSTFPSYYLLFHFPFPFPFLFLSSVFPLLFTSFLPSSLPYFPPYLLPLFPFLKKGKATSYTHVMKYSALLPGLLPPDGRAAGRGDEELFLQRRQLQELLLRVASKHSATEFKMGWYLANKMKYIFDIYTYYLYIFRYMISISICAQRWCVRNKFCRISTAFIWWISKF